MNKYEKIQTKYIEEIQSEVTIYRHKKTKARICTIENTDVNKVFSIAFRTPPKDNTGLTHILEHSVLCGSKKYPVKDPFVELLKGSLNTFLNAFTFPDKTMYPCASCNDEDFKNLMSVYMDAVFYPQIYNHEEIFLQEGWRYHILDEKDPITYNGVVYNEMKGAFSDPEQMLLRNIMLSLYPDTAYGYEGGGDPNYIPDLTFEDFKNFHQKYYHPSNSYIFLYGTCDMEERMDWLDKEYLSRFEYCAFDTTIKYQPVFDKPISKSIVYSVMEEENLDNKAFLSYNLVFPTTLDVKLMIAITVLVNALFDNPGAPIKDALIKAQLGDDVQTMFDDALLQPFLSIMVLNSNAEKEKEFISIIDSQLKQLVKEGIDSELLISTLNFAEFKARERIFSSGSPQGLDIEITCLSSWLYDENAPFSKLEVLKYYEELKEDIHTNYFVDILNKYFLNNTHKSYVSLLPSSKCKDESTRALDEKLDSIKNNLTHDELIKLIQKNKDLAVYQSEPSTKEEIDTLPKLELKDIKPTPEDYNCVFVNEQDYPILFSNAHTNDIAYVSYYFELTNFDFKDFSYLGLYANLFTYLSTVNTSYKDIHQFILRNTGGLKANVFSIVNQDKVCKSYFKVKYSGLTHNVEKIHQMVKDMLFNMNYEDEKRLYERLCEIKIQNEMAISGRGHSIALLRASSYCDEGAYRTDLVSGIGYLDFISELVRNFKTKKNEIKSNLAKICLYFSKNKFTLGFAGSKEQLDITLNTVGEFYNSLADEEDKNTNHFTPVVLNEGIKSQYDVNYVARSGKYNAPFHGALFVLSNALSLDYLWTSVRVRGGAYGCMLQIKPYGLIGFTSYRDPEVKRTNEVYENVISYIENLNPSDEDMLKFKIGAIGNLDPVMHISEKSAVAELQVLSGLTYETRKKYREQILNATKEELISFAAYFKEALKVKNICVIGNSTDIEAAKDTFDVIRNLSK